MAFFALLNHPNKGIVPLMDAEGEQIASFRYAGLAKEAIQNTLIGHHYGGKVFDTDEPLLET